MEILKFGGTSVANEQNISLAINIIAKNANKKIVVVSALSGVTDALISSINKAKIKDQSYKTILLELRNRHLEVIKSIPISENENNAITYINECFNHLDVLLEGCFLLEEISVKSMDLILSYGELLSSRIMFEKLRLVIPKVGYKDSRELIKTNANFGNATVNFEITNYLIQYFFDRNQANVTVMPGFIAESSCEFTTTLGRGGSDYTAAILAGALDVNQLEIWTDVRRSRKKEV